MASNKLLWILVFVSVSVFIPHGSSEQIESPTLTLNQAEEAHLPQGSAIDPSAGPTGTGPVPIPIQKPASVPVQGPSPNGEITEHRSPDGSIITVTRFNGQFPEHLLQPHLSGLWNSFEQQQQLFQAQRFQQEAFMREMYRINNAMFSSSFPNFYQPYTYYQNMNRIFYNNMQDMQGVFHPWNNPFMMNPFGWPYGPQRMNEGPSQAQPGSIKKKRSIDYASTPLRPTQSRSSNTFHYPALPDQYWTTHNKPQVPLVDEDNTKLDHIYGKQKQ